MANLICCLLEYRRTQNPDFVQAIESENWNRVIEDLHDCPRNGFRILQNDFYKVVFAVQTSCHKDATAVFERLIILPQMKHLSRKEITSLTTENIEIPQKGEDVSARPPREEVLKRVRGLLLSRFAFDIEEYQLVSLSHIWDPCDDPVCERLSDLLPSSDDERM